MIDVDDWTECCVEANGLTIEIAVSSAAAALEPEIQNTVAMSITSANELAGPARGLVTILIDDDERVRGLNKQWRGVDKPTNVLSFSYPESQAPPARIVGDIAISYETAAREADAEGKPLRHHLAHLSVHGFLHLLGYDHESTIEAEQMEQLERRILARIDVPDPYSQRGAAD